MAKLTAEQIKDAQKVIAKGLKALPDNYLDCRDMRHSWSKQANYRPREQHMEGKSRISPLLYRTLQCSRCSTVRTDVIYARTFERLSVAYTYPENYTIPGVPRGVKRTTVLRQESVRRANAEAAKAKPGERDVAEA